MSIEDNVHAVLVQQVFHGYSHALCFSVMCFIGAVPRRVPCSYQPWSHFSVHISQVSLQPLVLVSCNGKKKKNTLKSAQSQSGVDMKQMPKKKKITCLVIRYVCTKHYEMNASCTERVV